MKNLGAHDAAKMAAHATAPASGGERDHVDELLDSYRSGLEVLRRNLVVQFIFAVLGVLLIRQRMQDMGLPALGTTVPTTWLYYLVPLVLIYQWLDFGFVLDNLIKWRADAWRV